MHAIALSIAPLLALGLAASGVGPQDERPAPPREREQDRRGLRHRTDAATPGYLLFAPLRSSTTFLIDTHGAVVHRWRADAPPGHSVYLLENGNLLRCERVPNEVFRGGGQGGRIREYAPDGEVVWEYLCSDDQRLQHHDVERLPNGNLLLIAWELISEEEALAAGRDPRHLAAGQLWPDTILEIEPVRPSGGRVVWQWRAWDHLVQDRDPSLPNHGAIAEHPHRIDVNATPRPARMTEEERQELEQLRALGYVADAPDDDRPGGPGGRDADWTHVNSIDYSPELDLIVIGSRELSELWFIDHSTTTEEARGSSGGRYGRGGDLVARFGHPRWTQADGERLLFCQHDAQWIPPGLPGAGNILVFNNGQRGVREHSTVDEFQLPLDVESFTAAVESGERPQPVLVARYDSPDYSSHLSGAQRLASGNTLVCAGGPGRVVELTPEGEIVWDWVNPFVPRGPRRGAAPDDDRGPGAARATADGPNSPRAIFRAVHLAPDDPGLVALLAALSRSEQPAGSDDSNASEDSEDPDDTPR